MSENNGNLLDLGLIEERTFECVKSTKSYSSGREVVRIKSVESVQVHEATYGDVLDELGIEQLGGDF